MRLIISPTTRSENVRKGTLPISATYAFANDRNRRSNDVELLQF